MNEEAFKISEADIDNLSRAIAENTRVQRGGKETFCKAWPQAKEGLTLLRSLLDFVPGVGSFGRMAIAIVLAAGDAAERGVCG